MKTILGLLLLASPALAEDWQCGSSGGCTATIGSEQTEITFRKGDIVSTDDGWIVHPDDGWFKVRSGPGWWQPHNHPLWSPSFWPACSGCGQLHPLMAPPSPWLGAVGLGLLPPVIAQPF